MTKEKLLNQALACGFDQACVIDTDHLIFDSRFRQFCEMNYCGNYDNNYSCPPSCGEPEALKEKALRFSKALVLQTITPVKDIMDDAETKVIKHRHNEMTWKLIHGVEGEIPEYLPAMAGPCQLCSPCAKKRRKSLYISPENELPVFPLSVSRWTPWQKNAAWSITVKEK